MILRNIKYAQLWCFWINFVGLWCSDSCVQFKARKYILEGKKNCFEKEQFL